MTSIYILKVVSDKELENVFYLLAKNKKIARLYKNKDDWQAWFYKDKFSVIRKKLGDLLTYCESYFERWKSEILS